MITILVLSQKGGSGKTTIAVHLAICYSKHGKKTVLLDLDPQASAYEWNEARPEAKQLDAVKTNASRLGDLLTTASQKGVDVAIVDTPPHSDSNAVISTDGADFILIPCRPVRFDMRAVLNTIEIAKMSGKPYAVVLNAAPVRGKLAKDSRAVLENRGIPVVEPILHHRSAYFHAVLDGQSVHEYQPRGKATGEINKLYLFFNKEVTNG